MTRTYSLSDEQAPLNRILARLHALETGTPLANASISRGRARVLASGSAVAAIGHIDGKSGLLLRRGGAWVTTEEFIAFETAIVAQAAAAAHSAASAAHAAANAAHGAANAAQGTANAALSTASTALSTANGAAEQVGLLKGTVDGMLDQPKLGGLANYGSQHPPGLKILLVRPSDGRIVGMVDSPFAGS